MGLLKLSVAICLLSCAAHAQVAAYRIRQTSSPPEIDGRIDDVCWKRDACVVDKFNLLGQDAAAKEKPVGTKALLTYDQDFLYVAVWCEEPSAKAMSVKVRDHDGPTWQDDDIDIFLNPSGDRKHYVQLAINPAGVVMDASFTGQSRGMNLDYESEAVASTKIGGNEWTLEIKIPFSALPLHSPSCAWTFHIARNRRVAGQLLTCLESPVSGFHEIKKFDRLEGISLRDLPVSILDFSMGEMFQGTNVCRARLKNWSDKDVSVTVSVGLDASHQQQTVSIKPGGEADVEIPWGLDVKDKGKRVTLELKSGERIRQKRSRLIKDVPEIFGEPKMNAYYIDPNEFVRLDLPIQIAERSRKNAKLLWTAYASDGKAVSSGLTSVRDKAAVIRLYWLRWWDDRYTIKFELVRNEKTIAVSEKSLRFIPSPWGGF